MNVLIIEDENKTATLLKEKIENLDNYLVVNICQGISDSIEYLKKHQEKLDLIFMDIQLSDGESFEIFKLIEVIKPVIFCTAFDEFLLDAFKNNGIDYILKPFQQEDINKAILKIELIKKNFNSSINFFNSSQKALTYQKSFIVQQREKMIPLNVENIALIYIENDIVYALASNNSKSALFKTLDEVENLLNPSSYFRINRQMIVNREAITSIEPYFNRRVIVSLNVNNEKKAVVSRLKVTPFKNWLEKP